MKLKYPELSVRDLTDILGFTIKKDDTAKVITFLCFLSAYTDDCQFNILFNAPSSTGKSYIAQQISTLFPKEDIIMLGTCSPTAFFHEQGSYDKSKNLMVVDLSRKIILFLDQQNTQLLERLRSLFSHDEKEIVAKITDRKERGGNRTKTVVLKGYPAVVFCSAQLNIDEQEKTRFLLLSPDVDEEKITLAIGEKIKKEGDSDRYLQDILNNPKRQALMERIEAIKNECIRDIRLGNPELVSSEFFSRIKKPQPRHQRDIGRFIDFIKLIALFNLWHRERKDNVVISSDNDIREALILWEAISDSQTLGLSEYLYDIYKDVFVLLWKKNKTHGRDLGIKRNEITNTHFKVYGRSLTDISLRHNILPMFEGAGLIFQETSERDKRVKLIYPNTSDWEKDTDEITMPP